MDARRRFRISIPSILILLLLAGNLSSSEDLEQVSRASSTTYQLESEEELRPFLVKLFEKYGNNGLMTYEGFEHLLESIGLGNVQIADHDVRDHHSETGFEEFHLDHEHNSSADVNPAADESRLKAKSLEDAALDDKRKVVKGAGKRKLKERSRKKTGNKRQDGQIEGRQKRSAALVVEQKCATPTEILRTFRIQYKDGISQLDFVKLCPAIVYQLDQHVCHASCHLSSHDGHKAHCAIYRNQSNHTQADADADLASATSWKKWGFASLAVLVISLVGLAGVAVIPIMDKLFYNQLLQFLIALAIGSLTGDALLHLLPHAMVPHHSSSEADCSGADVAEAGHEGEKNAVTIGLISLFGIFLFFIMERLLNLCSERKRSRKLKLETRQKALDDVGRKLAEQTNTHCSNNNDLVLIVQQSTGLLPKSDDSRREFLELRSTGPELSEGANHVIEEFVDENQLHEHIHGHAHAHEYGHVHGHSHEHIHGHIHGHSHGHSHEAPNSVSSAAWMVIMGDGLHNFTDGLAIGASFANSLAVGLSTTVAVFCHELPHELGDFAVLLKAGMTLRQALVYNMVSSALCFVGMATGVAVGNMESTTSWIFAVTAGIFLYIALVDMLPQITSSDPTTKSSSSSSSDHGFSSLLSFVLHVTGIASGISSMLVIALFEDKIQLSVGD